MKLKHYLFTLTLLSIVLIALALVVTQTNQYEEALPTLAVLPTSIASTAGDEIQAVQQVDSAPQSLVLAEESVDETIVLPDEESVIVDDTAEDIVEPVEEVIEETVSELPAQGEATLIDTSTVTVPGRVVIHFTSYATEDERAAYIQSIGGTIEESIDSLDAVVVSVPDTVVTDMPESPFVDTSESDFYVSALDTFVPNDPRFDDQWGVVQIGAPAVWSSITENSVQVNVAVIDSGVCLTHPDLKDRLTPGWDYVQDDAEPQDEFGHGCGVAGIIAANLNNGRGIAGIAPNSYIMPLRVLDKTGLGTYSDVASAITYAVDHGAQIINLSLGGTNSSQLLYDAISYADSYGVLVVAAAGNNSQPRALYPAAYDEVVAVGSIDQQLNQSGFSNYGSDIDLWAPGEDILTTTSGNSYAMMNGTSFAAPHVTGIAALEIAMGRSLVVNGSLLNINPPDVVEVVTPVPNEGEEFGRPVPDVEIPAEIITDEWVVELSSGTNPERFARRQNLEYVGPLGDLESFYIFRSPDTDTSVQAAEYTASALEVSAQVEWFEQNILIPGTLRQIPTDPLYTDQWHLNGNGGRDNINVEPAWNSGYNGSGVTIAIVDDGLQRVHPDFSNKYSAAASHDFRDNDDDPSPNTAYDYHGTSVAGVAAADDNSTCGTGVAYDATVSGLRQDASWIDIINNSQILSWKVELNDVYNNSWGPTDSGTFLGGLSKAHLKSFQTGVTNGRDGKGSIYVWAGGNGGDWGDYSNADAWAGSRYTIAVAATNINGQRSVYSELGSNILVAAPSNDGYFDTFGYFVPYVGAGITTSDLLGNNGYNPGANEPADNDCTNSFGGTSSATPVVSGVVALMLEANPDLTWRDVQHILVNSADQNDASDSDWTTNGAGHHINHKYGFGRVNAGAAVAWAEVWSNVGDEYVTGMKKPVKVNLPIPDDSIAPGIPGTSLVSTFKVEENVRMEHVEVKIDVDHSWRGDLGITLISPSGTRSDLLAFRPDDLNDDIDSFVFTTVRNWDEESAGVWTLEVYDNWGGAQGILKSWQLTIYGNGLPAPIPKKPADGEVLSKNPVGFSWNKVKNAVSYEIQIDTVNPPASVIINVGKNTKYDSMLLLRDYYWRVRAVDEQGNRSLWSAIQSISVVSDSKAAPQPYRFVTHSPFLSWTSVSWSWQYEIEISNDSRFKTVLESRTVLGFSQAIITNWLGNGVYYWRVRAQGLDGKWGNWSEVGSFLVDVPIT